MQLFLWIDYRFPGVLLAHISREIDLKGSALSRHTLHCNVSVTLFDNAVDSGKPQARAFAGLLGGEEWLEDMRQRYEVDSHSCVGKRQEHVAAGLGTRMASHE